MFKQISRTLAFCLALFAPAWASAQAPAAVPAPAIAPAPAAAPPGATPAAAGTTEQGYILGPEDVVEYEVIGTNDKSRARIYADGTFQTNFGGRIKATGLTTRELGGEIAKALKAGGYYSEPVVNVEVVGYASRYVTVLGAINQPGLVPINRTYHLSEILARVGGVRPDAADYVIIRSESGGEKKYQVDKLAAGDPGQDPTVSPGDKIFSPPAELFYIYGQVNSPGSYPLKTGMTVAQAIAKGGGLTESGSDKKVKVRRGGKSVKLSADGQVEPGDVLTVSERLF